MSIPAIGAANPTELPSSKTLSTTDPMQTAQSGQLEMTPEEQAVLTEALNSVMESMIEQTWSQNMNILRSTKLSIAPEDLG
ncbi:MAG: hypothetical protein HWE20_01665 [Gammaproteobacteria bacterium]|nr:hypothetical protein [Gammaproteobacteria bacterium]